MGESRSEFSNKDSPPYPHNSGTSFMHLWYQVLTRLKVDWGRGNITTPLALPPHLLHRPAIPPKSRMIPFRSMPDPREGRRAKKHTAFFIPPQLAPTASASFTVPSICLCFKVLTKAPNRYIFLKNKTMKMVLTESSVTRFEKEQGRVNHCSAVDGNAGHGKVRSQLSDSSIGTTGWPWSRYYLKAQPFTLDDCDNMRLFYMHYPGASWREEIRSVRKWNWEPFQNYEFPLSKPYVHDHHM